MSAKPHEIDDKFAQTVLLLEEALFELDDLLENHSFKDKEKDDLITVKELAESARNLTVCVIASVNGKKIPGQQ